MHKMRMPSTMMLMLLFAKPYCGYGLVVATYNLWNIMYHWEIRKLYIAEMIQDVNADIVGFQEVRAHKDREHTQLDELQTLLPKYQYKYYQYLQTITTGYISPSGWEREGVGFLSRHKILSVEHKKLSVNHDSPDRNERVLFYVQFFIEDIQKEVNVVLVHLSYDRPQQCKNAVELLQYIYQVGVENTVLMGDFNVYDDFSWPIKAIADGLFEDDAPKECKKGGGKTFNEIQYRGYGYDFDDVWEVINPHHPGHTFSNMLEPGFINRPDRILVSKVGFKINSALILGKGSFYARKYSTILWWRRLNIIYEAAKKNLRGEDWERSCAWDCGPHGSCRCGVCVTGGDKNNCQLSQCSECSARKLSILYVILLLLIPCFSILFSFFFLFLLGIIRPRFRRVCIIKLILYRCMHRYLLLADVIIILVLFQFVRYEFDDVFRMVNSQLPEELNPSDHLMVVARLEIM